MKRQLTAVLAGIGIPVAAFLLQRAIDVLCAAAWLTLRYRHR